MYGRVCTGVPTREAYRVYIPGRLPTHHPREAYMGHSPLSGPLWEARMGLFLSLRTLWEARMGLILPLHTPQGG